MSLLQDVGLIGEVAGGVALIASGGALGILAGGLLIGSAAASTGALGKGLQGFANSAAGHDLVMAVGLASAAVAIEGAVANAGQSATSAAVNANVAPVAGSGAGPGIVNPATEDLSAAAPTVNGTVVQAAPGTVNLPQALNSTDQSLVAPGLSGQSISETNNAAAAATSSGQGSYDPLSAQAGSSGANSPTTTASNDMQAVQTPSQTAQNSPGVNGPGGAPTTPQPGGTTGAPPQTLAQKAGAALTSTPGMLMAGQAVSGLASGVANQKMMQEQIAAQQWGNMQWEQPGQVANLQSAAAAPITVPQGYLNRAAAVRQMMNGSTNQTAPLQAGGPGTAPPPMQPVGMPPAAAGPPSAGGGPVPVYQMGATPKGGVV